MKKMETIVKNEIKSIIYNTIKTLNLELNRKISILNEIQLIRVLILAFLRAQTQRQDKHRSNNKTSHHKRDRKVLENPSWKITKG
jgi:hypothetical protein